MTAPKTKSTRFHPVTWLIAASLAVAAVGVILPATPTTASSSNLDRGSAHPVEVSPAQPRLGKADGLLPEGVTVWDDAYPGVANLSPALLASLREAATAAADDGVAFVVTSGWRSPAYQNWLLQEATVQHGSSEEAARWVAPVDKSSHVFGEAIDLGDAAEAWLAHHGARYGLCPVYANEPWHYELRSTLARETCPEIYDDPTQDPRLW